MQQELLGKRIFGITKEQERETRESEKCPVCGRDKNGAFDFHDGDHL